LTPRAGRFAIGIQITKLTKSEIGQMDVFTTDYSSVKRVDKSWQARVCMPECFLNSHAPVKREQELMRVDWIFNCA
jgi:hypothetical protein